MAAMHLVVDEVKQALRDCQYSSAHNAQVSVHERRIHVEFPQGMLPAERRFVDDEIRKVCKEFGIEFQSGFLFYEPPTKPVPDKGYVQVTTDRSRIKRAVLTDEMYITVENDKTVKYKLAEVNGVRFYSPCISEL